MNDRSIESEFDQLDSALETAVQAVLSESVPDDAVERVIARAASLDSPAASPRPLAERLSRRWARYSGLAAAVTLAVAVGLWVLVDPSAGRAFAEVIKNVQQATSLEVSVSSRFGRESLDHGKMYLQHSRLRMEQFNGSLIIVCDLDRETVLYLNVPEKLYQLDNVDERLTNQLANPIDQIRGIKPNDAEHLGEEHVNGQPAEVYRVRDAEFLGVRRGGEMLVWVDPTNNLPVRIVVHDPKSEAETEIQFHDFRWNQFLDERLFALDPPADYSEGQVVSLPDNELSKELPEPKPVSPAQLARGILSEDRVPGRIVWGPKGATITAIMRDPESVKPQNRRQPEMRQWNVATGESNWSIPIHGAFSLAGASDGRWLVTDEGYEIQLRDPSTGEVARKWSTDRRLLPFAFSPDGKTLAAGIAEEREPSQGGVLVWNVEDGTLKTSWAEDEVTRFVRYSPDGNYLASSSRSVKIRDAATGELVRVLPYGGKFDFSPDGRSIACMALHGNDRNEAGRRYDVRICKLQTGEVVRTLVTERDTEESWILWIEFSPDGRLLAAADWNGTATLWSVETGEVVKTITEHKGGVHFARFSPNGKTLATGSEDRTLRLWSVDELANR